MSRYVGNNDKCPHCGVRYKEFHTGLNYADVYLWFCTADPDPSTWRYKRRNTILGRWHQEKKEQWKRHITDQCQAIFRPGDAFEGMPANEAFTYAVAGGADDVPF